MFQAYTESQADLVDMLICIKMLPFEKLVAGVLQTLKQPVRTKNTDEKVSELEGLRREGRRGRCGRNLHVHPRLWKALCLTVVCLRGSWKQTSSLALT